jgi:hypothetical protein
VHWPCDSFKCALTLCAQAASDESEDDDIVSAPAARGQYRNACVYVGAYVCVFLCLCVCLSLCMAHSLHVADCAGEGRSRRAATTQRKYVFADEDEDDDVDLLESASEFSANDDGDSD